MVRQHLDCQVYHLHCRVYWIVGYTTWITHLQNTRTNKLHPRLVAIAIAIIQVACTREQPQGGNDYEFCCGLEEQKTLYHEKCLAKLS